MSKYLSSFESLDAFILDQATIAIARAIISRECLSIEDVSEKFSLSREEAKIILDSPTLSRLISALSKGRKQLNHIRAMNKLLEIIENGKDEDALQAMHLLDKVLNGKSKKKVKVKLRIT